MFHIYSLSACLQLQQKVLKTALVIAKFKYMTFDPVGGVSMGSKVWGKILTLPFLSTGTWQSKRELLNIITEKIITQKANKGLALNCLY